MCVDYQRRVEMNEAQRVAEKLAPERMCQVPGMDDIDLAEEDHALCLKAIQEFSKALVEKIRAEKR